MSGEPLDPDKVRSARREEILYFRGMKVYIKVPKSECFENTGKAPIGVRWVDINKGDTTDPNYRSRLVAKEFKTDDRQEWYAATPPGECLKVLLSKWQRGRGVSWYTQTCRERISTPRRQELYTWTSQKKTRSHETKTCADA